MSTIRHSISAFNTLRKEMYHRQAGFSLIELCITVAIAALIMTVGVPSFQSLSSENHASSHLDEFNGAFRLARHLAVEHNRSAKVCPRIHGSDPVATPSCDTSGSANWGNGWIVMLQNESGNYTDIMTSPHPVDGTTWIVRKDSPPDLIKEVVFGPTGTLRPPSSPSVVVEISLAGCTKRTRIALTGSLSFDATGC
jgi:prepilin-type N-terminal cleavage/methylation domain-containing protein